MQGLVTANRDGCGQAGDDSLELTAVTKLKHAALWRACQAAGSQSALARQIGVSPMRLGEWVNLKSVPAKDPPHRNKTAQARFYAVQFALCEATGQTWDELFPQHLRDNLAFLRCPKHFERTESVRDHALANYASRCSERMARNSCGASRLDQDAASEAVAVGLKTLHQREREIIKLRYGIGGGPALSLDEVGRIFNVTRERIRQLEAKALRKLQRPAVMGDMENVVDIDTLGTPRKKQETTQAQRAPRLARSA